MMASTTFQSVSRRTITQVSVFPLEVNTRMVHPNYRGISLVIHIYWTMSTSCIYLPGLGGGVGFAPSHG